MSPNYRKADTPEQVVEMLSARLARGDLDALLALYDPDAVFTGTSDGPARGTAALREVFAPMVAQPPPLNVEVRRVVRAHDIALVIAEWELRSDGETTRSGHSFNVMRHHPEGGWRLLIDNPAGTQ